MKSMTGYGFSEWIDDRHRVTVDIRSYNNRYLDILLYLPHGFSQFELRFRRFLSSRIRRGKVEVYLGVEELEDDSEVRLDKKSVAAYLKALAELKEISGINEEIKLLHVLRMDGIFKVSRTRDNEFLWPVLESVLDRAFVEFDESRLVEGRNTMEDVRKLLDTIDGDLCRIEDFVPTMELKIREGLRTRFEETMGDSVDESRILSETAVLLMRFDINEEIVRMRSHLESFTRILEQEEETGKKLDFISQELSRETNTIGAKNMVREVDNSVISIKFSLEKIREQLRNVE